MAKAKKARKPRVRQPKLPGMEREIIAELDDAADNYFEVMHQRLELSKEEDEKKTALIEKMKEYGVDRYETDSGLVITVTAKSNVKARKKGKEDEPEAKDEGSEE